MLSKAARPKPSDWIQTHFYVPEPRDPFTGKFLPPGPLILSEMQCRLVDEALRVVIHPLWGVPVFVYTTILWSTIKKSGKSTLASAAALYVMENTPFGRAFCLANDGAQADDILYGSIKTCFELHNKLGGIYKKVRAYDEGVTLPNMSRIEALPCDAAGNAGKEPTVTLWSELHGFETPIKRKLFSEMTVPVTKFGRSIRWIETYAGYQGVSQLLWDQYQLGAIDGTPHPDFLDLTSDGIPVVTTNESAAMFCYWDHEKRMIWQQGEEGKLYYQQESKTLEPLEYKRLHENRWVSPVGSFIQPSFWDGLADPSLPLSSEIDNRIPVVVAMDASETNDCCAIVAVIRHPQRPDTDTMPIAARIFKPPSTTGTILLEQTLGRTILEWGLKWNIVVIGYDRYQLQKMVQDYRRGYLTIDSLDLVKLMRELGVEVNTPDEAVRRYKLAIQRWYYLFSQQNERAEADKMLYDSIVGRRIGYNPNDTSSDLNARGDEETLTKHIKQAGAKTERGQYRIQKLANNLKVDGAVAFSMAHKLCLQLNLSGSVVPLVHNNDPVQQEIERQKRLGNI